MSEVKTNNTATSKPESSESSSSVEEAGALLGAATTQLSSTLSSESKKIARKDVPTGMHSSFAIYPNTSTSLFMRLKSLKNLLSCHPSPLPSAPSLLAMLMKLLSCSSTTVRDDNNIIASNNNGNKKSNDSMKKEGKGNNNQHNGETIKATPMTSHIIRHLWVECVVLCHELGKDLSGKQKRVDIYAFVKTMMNIATLNPKSGKAQGGTRLAALQCLSALFSSSTLSLLLSGYSYDMIILCRRGIQSSGHGDPLHRMYCIDLACAILTCCRRPSAEEGSFLCQVFEDRVLQESFKLLKKAIEDKYPEVRGRAATFAMILVSGTVSLNEIGSSSSSEKHHPLTALEDLIQISKGCIDDESVHISSKFAEVFSRCICTSISYHQHMIRLGRRQGHNTQDETGDKLPNSNHSNKDDTMQSANIFKIQQKRKDLSYYTNICNSTSTSLTFLVELYLKVDTTRYPNLRYGYTLVILYFLKLQLSTGGLQSSEDGRGNISISEVLRIILNLVSNDYTSLTKNYNNEMDYYSIFRIKNTTPTANNNTRIYASRILRGLVELSSEMVQLTILHELIALSENLSGLLLQVALSEISHLVCTLEEAVASSSSIDKLLSLLNKTIVHIDYGVRVESSIVYSSVVTCPTLGNSIILQSLMDISLHKSSLSEILSRPIPIGITNAITNNNNNQNKRRFRLNAGSSSSASSFASSSLNDADSITYIQDLKMHQSSIHGHALLISRVMIEICNDKVEKDAIFNVVERLINSNRENVFLQAKNTAASYAAISTCVRAGYDILSSAIASLGSKFIRSHVDIIFNCWQRSTSFGSNIICIEAVLSNIIRFLQYCPELVIQIPDTLNRITILLESHFRAICEIKNSSSNNNTAGNNKLDMVKALLLECFAWLPYGSFPVIADDLFLFALDEIKAAITTSTTELDVSSSLLSTLVDSEDKVLDACSPYRADKIGQVIGTNIDSHLLALQSNIANPMEREMVYHSHVWKKNLQNKGINSNSSSAAKKNKRRTMYDSVILEIYQDNEDENKYPDSSSTNASQHNNNNMGSRWRQPPTPCPSSKVRLLDSAIVMFSSTFILQDAQEQERVMISIEELLPQHNVAKGGFAALMSETEKRTKAKSQTIATINITTTILSCVYNSISTTTIPLETSNINRDKKSNTLNSSCPRWMHKAKDIFFTLLSSQAFLVRRAAAEGIGWLASLGFSEEEQPLPSQILHTIDQVLKGNSPDGTVSKGSYDSLVSSKAGALLALGNIQRCHYHYLTKLTSTKKTKNKKKSSVLNNNVWSPPTMHMMTRVLATVASTRFDNDSYLIRSCALHSMGLLMHYLVPEERTTQELQQSTQIIRKAVSLVDDNFFTTWSIIPSSAHQERTREIFCLEPVLLSVLLRLVNIIQPKVRLVLGNDSLVINRFFGMVSTIVEISDNHPFLIMESLAFLEKVSSITYKYQEKEIIEPRLLATCLPLLKRLVYDAKPLYLIPNKSKQQSMYLDEQSFLSSPYSQHAILLCLQSLMESLSTSLKKFTSSAQAVMILDEMGKLPAYLFAFLEIHCSKTQCADTSDARSILCNREIEHTFSKRHGMKKEILFTINFFVLLQGKTIKDEIGKWNQRRVLLHWLLLAKELLSGSSSPLSENEESSTHRENFGVSNVVDNAKALAVAAASHAYTYNPPRWQVKSEACYVANVTLSEVEKVSKRSISAFHFKESASFNPIIAKNSCQIKCQNWISTLKETASNEPIMPTSLYSISPSSVPESYPSLHLEDLIIAACSASIATVDHAELPSLQNHGVALLSQLVKQFGDAHDPEFSGTHNEKVTILQQYSSQIVSSVKHSIRVESSSEKQQLSSTMTSAESELLFMSGCSALRVIVEKGLVKDPLVLRRLLRPLISLNKDLVLLPFPTNVEDCKELKQIRRPPEDKLYMRLYRVGSIGTIANLCVSLWMNGVDGKKKNSSVVLLDEMKRGVIDTLSVHSAIIALDAARILWKSDEKQDDRQFDNDLNVPILKHPCNLSFQSKSDISDTAETGYIQYWPVLATFATCHFMERISNTEDKTSEILSSWLKQIVPLLFLGLNDTMATVTCSVSSNSRNVCLSSEDDAAYLLFGIRCFFQRKNLLPATNSYNNLHHELKALVLCIIFGVMLPAVGVSKEIVSSFLGNLNIESTDISTRTFSESFILQSCWALVDVYSNFLPELIELFDDLFLQVILIPLGMLQTGYFDVQSNNLSSSTTIEIVSTCIKCVHSWIKTFTSEKVDKSVLKSMVYLSLSIYIQVDKQDELPIVIKDAVHDLFLECIKNLTKAEKINFAQEASRMGNWQLWKILCININEKSTVSRSFDNLKTALSNISSPSQHIPALAAISDIIQDTSYSNIICPLMHFVGVDILSMFKMYGLNIQGYGDNPIYRLTVCAESTRILMLAFQQLHSATAAETKSQDEKEESGNNSDPLSDYLKVLFTVLASVIDYNGLPNAIKENSGSEVAIGRMCAQSIVHVVRKSPLAFKASLIRVQERERGVLETAVRAEMTGYSKVSSNKKNSLPKKKLNLKAFRK